MRMQLQQRVNELQEVRVPHRPCFSQSPRSPFGPGAGSLSRLILTFLPHRQCHSWQGFLPGCRKPRRLTPAKRSWR